MWVSSKVICTCLSAIRLECSCLLVVDQLVVDHRLTMSQLRESDGEDLQSPPMKKQKKSTGGIKRWTGARQSTIKLGRILGRLLHVLVVTHTPFDVLFV